MTSDDELKQASLKQLQISSLFKLTFKCNFAAYLIIPVFSLPIFILVALFTGDWRMVPMAILVFGMQSVMFPFMASLSMSIGAWLIKNHGKHKGENITLVFDAQENEA